ncbi:hypothetical protein Hamer_G001346, partial [Homarus americanus]
MLFNSVRSLLFGDSVDVGLREDHGEASEVNVADRKLKEVGIRQAEAEAKAKDAEAKAKEADSENLRLRIQLGQSNPSNTDGLTPRSSFSHFDPARAARLMPTFSEETFDEFFIAFERLATTLKWPIEFWPILLQQAFADSDAYDYLCVIYVPLFLKRTDNAFVASVRRQSRPTLNLLGVKERYSQSGYTPRKARQGNTNNGNFVRERRSWTCSPPNRASKFSSYTCSFCGKPGEARESAVSVLVSRDFDLFQESFAKDPDVGTFRPFLLQGTVEVDGVETPVTILRDSGCLQTLIKEGIANVACMHELPAAGVDLVLCNDLAGGQMGNVTPPPVLQGRPESTAELQQLEDGMPGVFPLCAVTRSMSMTNDHYVTPDVDDSFSLEGLFANPIASQDISFSVNAVTGRVALIAAQEQDNSLRLLFDRVSDSANDTGPTTRYFNVVGERSAMGIGGNRQPGTQAATPRLPFTIPLLVNRSRHPRLALTHLAPLCPAPLCPAPIQPTSSGQPSAHHPCPASLSLPSPSASTHMFLYPATHTKLPPPTF